MNTEPFPSSLLQDPQAMFALLVSMHQKLVALEAEFHEYKQYSQQRIAALEAENAQLREENAQLREENAMLKRMLFGQSSERIEPIERILKKKDKRTPEQIKQQADRKRQQRQHKKQALPEQELIHEVKPESLHCPCCGGTRFVDLTNGEDSAEYEYVPGRLVKRRHIRQKKACVCGGHIVTAPGPARVTENCQYGPGLHAHIVVSKCLNSMPLYRQSKQFGREGLSVPKSSLGDMFHRSAQLLKPLWQRILEKIAQKELVQADETTLKVQQKQKMRTAWMWTFLSETLVAFVFCASRSGKTPEEVLKNSSGILQVDGYTGYNVVCTPEGRERAGCLAHVRRYFFKARATFEEEADKVLSWILKLYEVEYDAAEKGWLGSETHLELRKLRSQGVMEEWKGWLDENRGIHPPKSALSTAIEYTWKNWESLCVYLKDARVSLDNNASERALRTIAIGRKNFLGVGTDEAGESLAILQTLCASCEANGVNAQVYLADVLIRIQTHPNHRIDELLPDNWARHTELSEA